MRFDVVGLTCMFNIGTGGTIPVVYQSLQNVFLTVTFSMLSILTDLFWIRR